MEPTTPPKNRWRWPLYALAILLLILHQDTWNWSRAEPLLLGFLPIGLAYHAAYTLACSVLLFLFVKHLWPTHLESATRESSTDSSTNK